MENEISVLKVELKKWEAEFVKKYGRKPTKIDVAEEKEVEEKYEKFSKLKKKLHESDLAKKSPTIQSNSNENNQNNINSQNNTWGSHLLKKNIVKPSEKTEEKPSSRSTENWGDKIRKNIGTDSIKKLKKKNCENLKSDTSVPSHCEANHLQPVAITPAFRSQIKILSKTPKTNFSNHISNSPMFSSPKLNFSKNSPFMGQKRSSLLSKSVNLDRIKNEDLSDLTNLKNKENDDVEEVATDSSMLCFPSLQENDYGEIKNPPEPQEPFKNENREETPDTNDTETFLETHFREKSKNKILLSSNKLPSIKYEDICLESAEAEALPESTETSSNAEEPTTSSAAGGTTRKRNISQGNFVRINMKKKSFSRRGGSGNFLRKQVIREKMAKKGMKFQSGWKGRSGGFKSGGSRGFSGRGGTEVGYRDRTKDKCFKCGGTGHWASKCHGQGMKKKIPALDPEELEQNKESLEEILKNIDLITACMKGETSEPIQQEVTVSLAEAILPQDSGLINENKEVMDALNMFKYNSFRPGQDKAITRILQGLPTLLVLSTGSGKSLCYQLPAYLYAKQRNSITLVISPLVSLMDDQVRGLPKMMKATRIHSGMTKEQRNKALDEVGNGKVHVLLLSPEALTSWAGMSPAYSPLSKLPPIAFACIDECHCLSEWSHSFRPSYLRVCQVLRDRLGVKCLVGLTATATMNTCMSVAKQLGIKDFGQGIVAKIEIPPNLVLSISKDKYKDEAISQLLLGNRFSKLDSVIVYCTRRDEAARIASLLRIKMQDLPAAVQEESDSEAEEEGSNDVSGSRKRKRQSKAKPASKKKKAVILDAECYHAGMSAAERRRIQNRFMNGTLRVVVATVAFGMGIDKQDVRSVIHYNMPMSFERYVQEIGRAGRDGKAAHCHLFLNSEGEDLYELRRHSYQKTVDRYIVKQFIKMIFKRCECEDDEDCGGHFVAIDIERAIEKLDMKREGLETLLCYLESENLIQVLLPADTQCTLHFYGGPTQMIKAAKKCPAVALAVKLANAKENATKIEFDVVKIADELNFNLSSLKRLLRYLTWDSTLSPVGSETGKSGIEVEFSRNSFCVRTRRRCDDEFLDSVTELLHRRILSQENKEISQLEMCFNTMNRFSCSNVGNCMDEADLDKSIRLKSVITKYFKEMHEDNENEPKIMKVSMDEETSLRNLIRQFLHVHSNDLEHQVTGRAIARIFHGIDSPRYPAKNWGPAHRFWRSKLHLDFNLIRKIATEEIVGSVTST